MSQGPVSQNREANGFSPPVGLSVNAPTGAVMMYYIDILPNFPINISGSLWYLCDGNNGTPDLRGQFIRGWSDEVDQEFAGSSPRVNNYQTDEIKSHRHVVTRDLHESVGNGTSFAANQGQSNYAEAHTEHAGGEETRPKNFAMYFIIRTS